MSAGAGIPLAEARARAEALVALLEPACNRIEIAGSVRREKPEVHDIELVAVPKWVDTVGDDLWSTTVQVDALSDLNNELLLRGVLGLRPPTRNGDAYKALLYDGIPVDLFIVRPPADWGVIFAIRTGPGDWNHRLVTDCQRYLRRVENGRVYRSGKYVRCPEERDFFAAIGQAWVEPRERALSKVSIQA